MQRFELDSDNLVMDTRGVQERLTCGKKRNDNVNVRRSKDRLPDKKQKEGNVKYSKDHGASDGINAIGACNSHDCQEAMEEKIREWEEEMTDQPQEEENGGGPPFEWNRPARSRALP